MNLNIRTKITIYGSQFIIFKTTNLSIISENILHNNFVIYKSCFMGMS